MVSNIEKVELKVERAEQVSFTLSPGCPGILANSLSRC